MSHGLPVPTHVIGTTLELSACTHANEAAIKEPGGLDRPNPRWRSTNIMERDTINAILVSQGTYKVCGRAGESGTIRSSEQP